MNPMKTLQNRQEVADSLRIARTSTLTARALATEMDAEIAAIKNRFEPKIKAAQAETENELAAIQAYVVQCGASFFDKGSRTQTIDGHKLGFRDNGGAVKTVKGLTEKKALSRLLKIPRLAALFTRNKPSMDKEAIAAKWAAFKGTLTKLGFRLVREDVFFVDLDITPDPAQTADGKGGK